MAVLKERSKYFDVIFIVVTLIMVMEVIKWNIRKAQRE